MISSAPSSSAAVSHPPSLPVRPHGHTVNELYGVAVLPGARRVEAVGLLDPRVLAEATPTAFP